MWFTGVDIARKPGGHAGMQRSQPLQWSTSIVTVPRLLIVLVASGMRRAPLPCRVRVGGEELPARGDRPLVGFDVLRAVRRGPWPPPPHEGTPVGDAPGARRRTRDGPPTPRPGRAG